MKNFQLDIEVLLLKYKFSLKKPHHSVRFLTGVSEFKLRL